jgi:hypothetical protein
MQTSVVNPRVELDHDRPANDLLQEIIGVLSAAHFDVFILSET